MSDYIERNIAWLQEGSSDRMRKYSRVELKRMNLLSLFEALKQAEEALRGIHIQPITPSGYLTYDVNQEMVNEALAMIAALGKDHIGEANKMVSGKGE